MIFEKKKTHQTNLKINYYVFAPSLLFAQYLKITEKVSYNIASGAIYVYI